MICHDTKKNKQPHKQDTHTPTHTIYSIVDTTVDAVAEQHHYYHRHVMGGVHHTYELNSTLNLWYFSTIIYAGQLSYIPHLIDLLATAHTTQTTPKHGVLVGVTLAQIRLEWTLLGCWVCVRCVRFSPVCVTYHPTSLDMLLSYLLRSRTHFTQWASVARKKI